MYIAKCIINTFIAFYKESIKTVRRKVDSRIKIKNSEL